MIINHFSRDMKGGLESFLKASARKTVIDGDRNPSWIICLPIFHFLKESLHPFAELDFSNFEDKKTNWWIDIEFEKEKEDLKNTRIWSRLYWVFIFFKLYYF